MATMEATRLNGKDVADAVERRYAPLWAKLNARRAAERKEWRGAYLDCSARTCRLWYALARRNRREWEKAHHEAGHPDAGRESLEGGGHIWCHVCVENRAARA